MAHDEDDFRIRPGKVRDRGGRLEPRAASACAPTSDQLRRRGASGDPARWRQPQSTDGDREGRRPVQRAGPGRCDGADAQGSERVEPGRERGAHAGAAGGGEGPRREAQPAARSRARTAVRQRQGGGRASALPRTRRRDARRREGPGLFGRARRGGRPRFPRPGPRGSPPVPFHRLGRGRGGAVRPARDHPRSDEADGSRPAAPSSTGSRSITTTPATRTPTSSCAASPTTARPSTSPATTSPMAFASGRARSSPWNWVARPSRR